LLPHSWRCWRFRSTTVAAVEGGPAGIYNVVDDEPAPVSEFLPVLAAAVGAKRPLRVPRWLGRLAAGEVAVMAMTEIRGASNDKAKRELGWQLRYPTWREGFEEVYESRAEEPAGQMAAAA
jgi:nucleoside-diphosphate-sugar epimerase